MSKVKTSSILLLSIIASISWLAGCGGGSSEDEANRPPYFVLGAPATVLENTFYAYQAWVSDPDTPKQRLTCSINGLDTCGGRLAGCYYTFATDETMGGTQCVVGMTVTDDGVPSLSASQAVTISIIENNDPQTATVVCPNGVYTGNPINCTVTVTDSDIPPNVITCSVGADDTCGGVLTGCTSYNIAVATADCRASIDTTDDAVPPLTVNAFQDVLVNLRPQITSTAPDSAAEGAVYTYNITATDREGNPITLSKSGDTCAGVLTDNHDGTGDYTFTPTESQGGTSCVVGIVASDGGGAGSPQQTTVNIAETNQAPTLVLTCPTEVNAGNSISCTVAASDADIPSNVVTCSIAVDDTCAGVLTGCTGYVKTSASSDCRVSVNATDDAAVPATTNDFTDVTVNQRPVITSTALTTGTEAVLYTYNITATDNESDAITLAKSGDTCGGGLIDNGNGTGTYSFTPGETLGGGTCVVGIVASDAGGAGTPQQTTVSIAEDNKAPSISNLPATASGPATKSNSFNVDATDPDIPADTLTFSMGTPTCTYASGFSIVGSTGVVSWTCGNTPEICTVNVTVTDDGTPPPALSNTKTLTIDCNDYPTYAGSVDSPQFSNDVYVSGNYAYVADLVGLIVVNVSNPTAPSIVNTLSTGSTNKVNGSGNYVYATNSSGVLYVYDISSNPSSPPLAGSFNSGKVYYDVYASGNYAYVSVYDSGASSYYMQILNISNLAAITSAGTVSITGTGGIWVNGTTAYVADGASLRILDVSNPASVTQLGSYPTDSAVDVFVVGNYAYVADVGVGLRIINISNPASPSQTGTIDTPAYERSIFVSGNYAFFGEFDAGIWRVNVSNPAAPTLAGGYNTPGFATGVFVSGKYLYVSDGDSGLQVLQIAYP